MGSVTFLTFPFRGPLVAHSAPQGSTLLALAGEFDLKLHAECRESRCGACAVKVAVRGRWPARSGLRMTWKEKKILFDAGKITREQFVADHLPHGEPVWRLACEYVVHDEEIVVAV